jgi:hypothetical protein
VCTTSNFMSSGPGKTASRARFDSATIPLP